MGESLERNRLGDEASPYLRQHADNPVNWQPWDEKALLAARERDRPIFLSIGYSACHWCHVMESESFADETVAEVLNEGFVPIKVDREERPDIDSIYMTVCQLVTGRGGWPLSAWLTPDGRPFYVGTYFPREPQRGTPGFLDVLRRIRVSWSENRAEIESRADEWAGAARDRLDASAGSTRNGSGSESAIETDEVPGNSRAVADANQNETIERVGDALLRAVDDELGGFGRGGPKFPQPRRIDALLRNFDRTGRTASLDAATRTLDAMCDGGLYDHVGGGFHRYCVDADWTVPHFEKMLYDNATISRTLLAAYQVTGDDRYDQTVRETVDFLDRELSHPDGGFYSTLDAQSPDEDGNDREGAFYVWTPSAIEDAIEASSAPAESATLFCDRYGVTESGNFEGKSVLTVTTSIEELAAEYDLSESDVESRLDSAHRAVFEARESRQRPNRDEKILAGWNGLAIDALAEAAIVLQEDRYRRMAEDALSFVRENLWDPADGRLARRYKDGDVAIDGYLEDYAFLARGALTSYEASGEVDQLAFALDLARTILSEFWDEDARTLYFTPESGESLLTRPQELSDQSTPSPTGVAAELLTMLDPFAEESFADVAGAVLSTHADTIDRSPIEHVSLALARDRLQHGPLELTTVSETRPTSWADVLAETYLPSRLVASRPPSESTIAEWLDRLSLEEVPPIWAERTLRDGKPTVYACRDRVCSPPVHEIEDALAWHEDEPAPI